jgi:urate oxidase
VTLISHNYGKQRVRVLKVLRSAANARHDVKELEIGVRLQGSFESSYTRGDNSKVVATDTMKNTVQALAHRHLETETEPFVLLLARHFLDKYEQVERVAIESRERQWSRLVVSGEPHAHAFTAAAPRPRVEAVAIRGGREEIRSGVEELLVLKSTGSGFSGYPRCEFTTLPETEDRILSTLIQSTWRWTVLPPEPSRANGRVLDAMLRVFAELHSPSVQTTMWEMAQAAFEAVSEIDEITLALPNKHYLPVNLSPFGIDATGVSFVPTDEPHGQIEATIARTLATPS